MSLKQTLVEARTRIEAGWCKHTMHDRHANAFCAAGALFESADHETEAHALLRSLIPSHFIRGMYTDLAAYNDHRTTTKEDILALYDRAIAAAGE